MSHKGLHRRANKHSEQLDMAEREAKCSFDVEKVLMYNKSTEFQ